MGNFNKEYNEILKKCKFISKPDEWFINGSEAVLLDENYCDYLENDTFNKGYSLFSGYTNETYKGYNGEFPRPDQELCPFDEFYIYDESGVEISEMTLNEYKKRKGD